jgi:hypothetical protein
MLDPRFEQHVSLERNPYAPHASDSEGSDVTEARIVSNEVDDML